ncbi:MAG: hypothetical protein J0G94_08950 [Sphingomonadales bacterium]|nr:hypothetical protein [Sphingomonadales bacterium]
MTHQLVTSNSLNVQQIGRGAAWAASFARPEPLDLPRLPRVGVISNLRSHRNRAERRRMLDLPEAFVIRQAPDSRPALDHAMRDFAQQDIELIVIDGGDGTVREVVSSAHAAFGARMPRFAILRAGKTNALAMDLGVPKDWTLEEVIAAHLDDRVVQRGPIRISWAHGKRPDLFGFIFGFGAYSRATMLAQKVHRRGWFNSLAVFITLSWALLRTMLGGAHTPWTRGDAVRISRDDHDIVRERLYLLLGSTLHDLPVGLRPFGRPREGLKFLAIKAPPRRLWHFLPSILSGRRSDWLEAHGIFRRDADYLTVSVRKSFILDGERYPGGNLTISQAAPIAFVVP